MLNAQHAIVRYKFYLHEPMTVEELSGLLQKLQLPVGEIIRTTEPEYSICESRNLSEAEWLQAIIAHPALLQRPIVVHGNKAVIARPAEKVLTIL